MVFSELTKQQWHEVHKATGAVRPPPDLSWRHVSDGQPPHRQLTVSLIETPEPGPVLRRPAAAAAPPPAAPAAPAGPVLRRPAAAATVAAPPATQAAEVRVLAGEPANLTSLTAAYMSRLAAEHASATRPPTSAAPEQPARGRLFQRLGRNRLVEELLREGERLEEAAASSGRRPAPAPDSISPQRRQRDEAQEQPQRVTRRRIVITSSEEEAVRLA